MKTTAEDKSIRPTLPVQIIVTLVFIGLLIIPIVVELTAESPKEKINSSEAKAYALEYFGFFLDEVSVVSGIDFAHEAPILDSRLDHIMPTIASVGASVSICDYNNDGWNDIYLPSSRYGSKNELYKNNGDGTFDEVGSTLGVGDVNRQGTGVSMGAVWADINNDGFEDLFVYKWGKPMLFLNENGERFLDITDSSGFPAWINSNTAIWLDYNNDGLVDLFIGGYYKEEIDLWDLDNTLIMPESFEYANNGGRNYLMENQGDNTFKDVAIQKGLITTKWTLAAGAADFDNNGFQDLFVANDYSIDELYMNYGEEGFSEVGKEAKIGYAPKSGMNVSIADIRNNDNFGVYVSNITEMGILLQGNNLWELDKDKSKLSFSNNAGRIGLELGGWSYGSQFGDLNNDGFQDLYLANGYISATKNNSYWYDYSKVTGGNKTIISDAMNWPAMEGRSQSGFQQNKIWVNGESGTFADVTEYVSTIEPYDSRAVAMVDLWNRGVLDVVVANQRKEVSVLKNESQEVNNWISFKLEGTKSNRSAIGAKVTVLWAETSQSQVVSGGMGFSSQNQRTLHFGVGKAETVKKIVINWPSGLVETFSSLEINKIHHIKEGNENS